MSWLARRLAEEAAVGAVDAVCNGCDCRFIVDERGVIESVFAPI